MFPTNENKGKSDITVIPVLHSSKATEQQQSSCFTSLKIIAFSKNVR